jgi:nitroreductase
MGNFLDLVLKRQSVRRYLDKAVERDKIERCLEAARLAPSACNAQPWKFVVFDEPVMRSKIAAAAHGKMGYFNKFAEMAPVMVVIVIEKSNLKAQIGGRLLDKDYYLYDIGITATHFCLQATEEGLGTCIMGWFDEKKIHEALDLPKNKKVGLLITLGYSPADYHLRTKIRKPIDKVCSYNTYPQK